MTTNLRFSSLLTLVALGAVGLTVNLPQFARAETKTESDAFERIRVTFARAPKMKKPGSSTHTGVVETALVDPFYTEVVEALESAGQLTPAEIRKNYAPIERAMMQRKLWEWFDALAIWWSAETLEPRKADEQSRCRALFKAIAPLLKMTALSKEEIASLPDTVTATAKSGKYPTAYNPERPLAAYFPADLFDDKGPWVCLDKERHRLSATFHTEDKSWRSVFHIYMRLPGKRADTLGYLATLRGFRDSWTTKMPEQRMNNLTLPNGGIHNINIHVNPETPQFPTGTQFALVEQVLLIDDKGEIVMSPIVVKVELRTYLVVDPEKLRHDRFPQALADFSIKWEELAAEMTVLEAQGASDVAIPDLEKPLPPTSVARCMTCHSGWGLHSVNSRAQLFEARTLMVPRFIEGNPETTAKATIAYKRKNHTWGLLQGLWSRP